MSEFNLGAKFVLADKQEAEIPLTNLTVSLAWTQDVDLDLLLFYKDVNGKDGGVASDHFPNGTLNETYAGAAFLTLSGDAGVGATGGDNLEVGTIHTIPADVSEIHIVVLNYSVAKGETQAQSFADFDGFLKVAGTSDEHSFGMALADPSAQPVFHVAKITNEGGKAKIQNVNEAKPVGFLGSIPGTWRLQ